jgi:hypothetical protein
VAGYEAATAGFWKQSERFSEKMGTSRKEEFERPDRVADEARLAFEQQIAAH